MPEYTSKFLINTGELISLTSVAFSPMGYFWTLPESSIVRGLLMWVPAMGMEVASYHHVLRSFGVVDPLGICIFTVKTSTLGYSSPSRNSNYSSIKVLAEDPEKYCLLCDSWYRKRWNLIILSCPRALWFSLAGSHRSIWPAEQWGSLLWHVLGSIGEAHDSVPSLTLPSPHFLLGYVA